MNNNHKIYQFGIWQFNQETAVLSSKQHQQSLPRLLAQLLSYFIQHRNRVVTRDELIEILWKDKFVNENALSRAIAELRKALKDSASQPQFIKTLPKKGYQFIHPVIDVNQQKKKQHISFLLWSTLLIAVFTLSYFINDHPSLATQLTLALNKAQRMTAHQGMEQQPRISADGKRITYHHSLNGQSHTIIYDIEQQKNMEDIHLNTFSPYSAMLSPQGDRLIMAIHNPELETSCQLLIKNLISKAQQPLGQCSAKNDSSLLTWGKDDNHIIYADQEPQFGTTALWQMNLSTGKKNQLTFPESIDYFDNTPEISPDGRFLSFSRGNQQTRNLYLHNLQDPSQPLIALTNSRHYSVSHTWVDDKHIIMDSDRTGERLLWLLNIDDKKPQLLGARGAQFPSVDNKRKKLAFQVAQYEANIWLIDLETQQQKRIIHSTKYDNNPAFSPNGEQFAFSSNRQNLGVIWLYDFETAQESKLFELPASKLTRPSWSADGQKLLVTANNEQGLWSYELNMTNKKHRKLNFNQENIAAIYINDNIYAMSKPVNGESSLLKLDTAGNTNSISINGISRFMASTDGKIVISTANKDGLFLVDLDTLQQQVLVENFPSSDVNHWTSSGQYLYYRDHHQGHHYVTKKLNINTRQTTIVSDTYASSVGPSMSIDHKHNRLLITKTDRAESDIFITDLNINPDISSNR